MLVEGDANLSGERYRVAAAAGPKKWPMVKLGEVCEVIAGQSPEGEFYNELEEGMPFYQGKTEFGSRTLGPPVKWTTVTTKVSQPGDILMSVRAPVGPVNLNNREICIGRGLAAIRAISERVDPLFVFSALQYLEPKIKGNAGATFASINRSDIESLEIPLPPLPVQQQIVAEVARYQAVIDGARQVADHWKPSFAVDPEWPVVKLGEVAALRTGTTPDTTRGDYFVGSVPFVKTGEIDNCVIHETESHISLEAMTDYNLVLFPKGTILMAMYGQGKTRGQVAYLDIPACTTQNAAAITAMTQVDSKFLYSYFLGNYEALRSHGIDGHISHLNLTYLKSFPIPLPPLDVQQQIVQRIEAERELVEANKRLIELMKQRIDETMQRVWR